jgi:hypothetical protein
MAVVALVAACSTGPGSTAIRSPQAPGASSATVAPVPHGSLPSQTDTAWGRIWDAVADTFPVPFGAEPATDTGEGPSSGQLVVTDNAGDVADGYVTQLGAAGWTVGKDGPLEDGSIVVSATKGAACKAQVTVRSAADGALISVLYGAACPFE